MLNTAERTKTMAQDLLTALSLFLLHHSSGSSRRNFASAFAPRTVRASFAVQLADKNPFQDTGGVPSYSDNWLFRQHNNAQQEYQLKTSAVQQWNAQREKEEASIKEWQEAFRRNGLADFTPPMTSAGLNCLLVGADVELDAGTGRMTTKTKNSVTTPHEVHKLPWENEAEADITSLRASVQLAMAPKEAVPLVQTDAQSSATESGALRIQTELVRSRTTGTPEKGSSTLRVSNSQAATYDCIVDQGLLGSVLLTTTNVTTVQELLEEASLSLREHGIYVLTTVQLPNRTKAMLETLGLQAGLEWEFALDGISTDDKQISVARRFNTGVIPRGGNRKGSAIFKTFQLTPSSIRPLLTGTSNEE